MAASDPVLEQLPEDVRDTLRRYVKDVGRVFGPSLVGLILYGSAARGEYVDGRSNLNLLALLDRHDLPVLMKHAKMHQRWNRERIVAPLLVTASDLADSHRVFPLEYADMQECHLLLSGRDPLAGLHIDDRYLAFQCEREVRGNLLRLRQRFVEGGGTTEAMAILLPLSLTALLAALRGVLRVLGVPPPRSTEGLLQDLKSRLGLDSTVFEEVWQFKRGILSPGPAEVPRLYERYLHALEAGSGRIHTLLAESRR